MPRTRARRSPSMRCPTPAMRPKPLQIDVEQVAGVRPFVAPDKGRRVEAGEAIEPGPRQDARHRGSRHLQRLADLPRCRARMTKCEHGRFPLGRRPSRLAMRARRPIGELPARPGQSLGSPAACCGHRIHLSEDVHQTDYEVAGRVQLVAPLSSSSWPPRGLLDGLSQSTIRGQSRMKVSVGEPHSDQRDHPVGRPDGLVRGPHLWIAVKLRGSTLSVYAASRAARDGSSDCSCVHSA
jgi:hypothetical protein